MNIYLFWILFLALWAIVPLMVIKGRTDDSPKIESSSMEFLIIFKEFKNEWHVELA